MDIDAEYLGKDHILRSVSRESSSELLMPLNLKQKTQLLCLRTVGEEAIVANLLEPSGQHMHQEAADEFLMSESHLLAGITVTVVLVPESDCVIGHIRDAAIRDRNTMSVAAEIADGIAKTIESLLDVRTPVSAVQAISK